MKRREFIALAAAGVSFPMLPKPKAEHVWEFGGVTLGPVDNVVWSSQVDVVADIENARRIVDDNQGWE